MKPQPYDLYFDGRTLKCPLLFVKAKQWLKKLQPGQQLLIEVIDRVGAKDIENYLDKHNFRYTMSESQATNKAAADVQFCIATPDR
jgi:TusA-related sulfurtransferase